jgi:hypothetical protein
MPRQSRVVLPTMFALWACLVGGCTASNEEGLGGQTSKAVPHKEGTPDFKSYAEAQTYQTQQAAKNRAARKGQAPGRNQ